MVISTLFSLAIVLVKIYLSRLEFKVNCVSEELESVLASTFFLIRCGHRIWQEGNVVRPEIEDYYPFSVVYFLVRLAVRKYNSPVTPLF